MRTLSTTMTAIPATTAITTAVVTITIIAMIIAIRTIRRHVSTTESMTIIVKIPAITILVISKTFEGQEVLVDLEEQYFD